MRYLVLPLLLVLACGSARSQTSHVDFLARVAPEAGLESGVEFGGAVSVDGAWAAVGARSGGALDRSGAVYVFRRVQDVWTFHSRLLPSEPQPLLRFGTAVAIEDGRLAVGAPGYRNAVGTLTGAVFVFEQRGDSWEEVALVSAELQDRGVLGSSVALSGDTILSGAPSAGVSGGAALFIRRFGAEWAITDTLRGESGTFGAFASSVDLEGDRAVVHDDRAGILQVYERDAQVWSEVIRDTLTGGSGTTASLSGDWIAVGQDQNAEGRIASTILYERRNDTWVRADTLTPSDADGVFTRLDGMGLEGNTLVMQLDRAGPTGPRTVVYIRTPLRWMEQATLDPDDSGFGDYPIAIDGRQILIGSPEGRDANRSRTGLAMMFSYEVDPNLAEQQILTVPGQARTSSQFGRTVAFNGNSIIAGTAGSGLVYVLNEQVEASSVTWTESQALRPSRDENVLRVAAEGEWMLAGDFNENRVYAYRREEDGWVADQTLSGLGSFGYSIALDGERAIIGAPLDGTGAAFVYERSNDNWLRTSELRGTSESIRFGHAVALSGGRALVSSRESRADGGQGHVLLYERSASRDWVQTRSLGASGTSGIFGNVLALEGSRILVGTQVIQGPPEAVETVGVYGGLAPVLQGTLSGPVPRASFGASLAIDGDRVLVGAPASDISGSNAGAAYLFEFDGVSWFNPIEILAPDGAVGDLFGTSVDVDGQRLLIGAPADDTDGSAAGSAFVFASTFTVPSDRQRPLAGASLTAPYPNPVGGRATLTFETPAPVAVTITLHDALGRRVQTLLQREVAGRAEVTVESGALASGVYLVRAAWTGGAQTRTLTILR